MAEAGVVRKRRYDQTGLVVINHAELVRKLRVRGKTKSALTKAKAASNDTLSRITQGKPVQTFVLERITAQLAEWPELQHAADLLESEAV